MRSLNYFLSTVLSVVTSVIHVVADLLSVTHYKYSHGLQIRAIAPLTL